MAIPAQTQHFGFQRTAAPPGLRGCFWRHTTKRFGDAADTFGGRHSCRFPGVDGRMGGVAHFPGMSTSNPRETVASDLEPISTTAMSVPLGVLVVQVLLLASLVVSPERGGRWHPARGHQQPHDPSTVDPRTRVVRPLSDRAQPWRRRLGQPMRTWGCLPFGRMATSAVSSSPRTRLME